MQPTRCDIEDEGKTGDIMFWGWIVVGKGMVVIVVSFTGGAKNHDQIFSRVHLLLVRTRPPQMRHAVYRPRQVQSYRQSGGGGANDEENVHSERGSK